MVYCSACGASMSEASRFCSLCGMDNAPLRQYAATGVPQQNQPPVVQGHPFASRGFGQMFGLDPRIAFLAFLVDFMLFSGGALSVAATAGLSLPVLLFISSVAGVVLGFITHKAQMKWFGDDHESALIKGVVVGLLTAIPVGIPAVVWVPSGILGWLQNRKRLAPPN
jgi:hypothetical protein